jgi:hypothetical protein
MAEERMINLSKECSMRLDILVNRIVDACHYNTSEPIENTDLSMFSTDVQNAVYSALAEKLLAGDDTLRKDVGKAIILYKKAGHLDRIVQLGNELLAKCRDDRQLEVAEQAFLASGRSISAAQYNSFGKKWLRQGRGKEYEAVAAFTKARNRRALIHLAATGLREGDFSIAEHALKAIGRKVSKKQYKLAGDINLRRGELIGALNCYERAGDKKGMLNVGNKALDEGWLEEAKEAYKRCRRKMMPTREQYSKAGDWYVKRSQEDQAVKAYKLAGNTDALLKIANSCLKKDSWVYLSTAFGVYHALRMQIPQERLLQIIEGGGWEEQYLAYRYLRDTAMSRFVKQFTYNRKSKEREQDE